MVERKPRRHTGRWLLILLVLIAAAVAVWFLMFRGDAASEPYDQTAPISEPAPATEPAPFTQSPAEAPATGGSTGTPAQTAPAP